MPKVKFLELRIVGDPENPEDVFRPGDIRDLNPASCHRWVRRGVAEYYDENEGTQDAEPAPQPPLVSPKVEAEPQADEPKPKKRRGRPPKKG